MKLNFFLLLTIVPGIMQVAAGQEVGYISQVNFKELNMQKTDISQQLKDDYKKVHEHLYKELIPFWKINGVDKNTVGSMTNFDSNGMPINMPEKYLNTQCRMIWWFSQLNIIAPTKLLKNKAKQGVDFLIRYLWDDKNGGWSWKVKKRRLTA